MNSRRQGLASEVMRSALRLLAQHETHNEAVRRAGKRRKCVNAGRFRSTKKTGAWRINSVSGQPGISAKFQTSGGGNLVKPGRPLTECAGSFV
ncbi:type II toxin-antitoxin system ParD family antitoxin [Erwinia amylovora]|uniref:type II toxin-antitoxin system ParD family antitoxin n=1 Tax=Erwinia amylovora TaxID=552 RepID=UPI00352BB6EA